MNNRDTEEISMIIENNYIYYTRLKECIGNELYFLLVLYVAIDDWNETLDGNDNQIDSSKVNGNEVYISFCKTCGIETEGWK